MRLLALVLTLGIVRVATAGDWAVRRDPFDRAVVARTKAILSRAPHDAPALTALVTLYKRYRTVEQLTREYEADSSGWSAIVIRAHLAERAGDRSAARALFAAATTANADDVTSWLALANLEDTGGDQAAARVAFEHARDTAKRPADKIAAVRGIARLAEVAGDVDTVERAYDVLTELLARDGRLWLERAETELRIARPEAAVTSYVRAEALLARDPERKLLAIAGHAMALDKAGLPTDAVATYERAIAASPPGYYLRQELALRIIDVFRRHESIAAAVDYLDHAWPVARRRAFEWGTLASLYAERGEMTGMMAALHKAVAIDPKAVDLQWQLIRYYDKTHDSIMAMSVLENAADALPSDLDVQLELAQRLWLLHDDANERRAHAVAAAISKRLPKSADAHRALAEIYARWDDPELVVQEAAKVAALDPTDDSYVLLGDAHFIAAEQDSAITAWKHIGDAGTPAALHRLADVYMDHQLWTEAVDAYTAAMFGDTTLAALWIGRANAFAQLGRYEDAASDAQHAVDLGGLATFDEGHAARIALVTIVSDHARSDDFDADVEPLDALIAWDKAFSATPADVRAGYLLAEYFSRKTDHRALAVLERLHVLQPRDLGVARELVRIYRAFLEPAKALVHAKWLLAADPAHADEMRMQIASIEGELPRPAPLEAAVDDTPPYRLGSERPILDVVPNAYVVGSYGMRGASSASAGVRLLAGRDDRYEQVLRGEIVRRGDITALAAGAGIATPVVRADWGNLMVGAAFRTEVRFDDSVDRLGFLAEGSVELLPVRGGISVGARIEQSLSDHGALTALGLQLGFSAGSGASR